MDDRKPPMTVPHSNTRMRVAIASRLIDMEIQAILAQGRGEGVRGKGASKRTHTCGFDNGKSKLVPQPRNAPCQCGSGKKAKRCCVYVKKAE